MQILILNDFVSIDKTQCIQEIIAGENKCCTYNKLTNYVASNDKVRIEFTACDDSKHQDYHSEEEILSCLSYYYHEYKNDLTNLKIRKPQDFVSDDKTKCIKELTRNGKCCVANKLTNYVASNNTVKIKFTACEKTEPKLQNYHSAKEIHGYLAQYSHAYDLINLQIKKVE